MCFQHGEVVGVETVEGTTWLYVCYCGGNRKATDPGADIYST